MKQCFNCGIEVDDGDFDILPNGCRLYICGNMECNREHTDTLRQMEEEAVEAVRDQFRY